ncbi:squalene cyclase [Tessaracoccus oleiagri]|uniref:Squalene cyclase n=1 Tax=Tessaracoccus oleiagri TaxID=686624 RepID=A0A1G9LAU1_9ACTN|nr:squalene cyclase [Tessaracoccus oleiagri]SDL58665.1 hypothetical protein SAMN04488242_2120 [Tessaracoccus oleiagri]
MSDAVVQWLMHPVRSDPSIRWQVMRDLLEAPEIEWQKERARVATEGWGARLLAVADAEGGWAGGAHFPADYVWGGTEKGQPWTATSHVLTLLREFGLPPSALEQRVASIRRTVRWEHAGQPYWEGEVEPCINGSLVANGAYFGVDVGPVVERLIGERLDDGGWNCEAERGSVRSSFDTTIAVLEGLLAYEAATGGTPASREARRAGEEYLLVRHLFRRLSTGEPADEKYLSLLHPNRWHYDVLRGLDHFRAASLLTGQAPDPRMSEAAEHVRRRRLEDGRWPLDRNPEGRDWLDIDAGPGKPSRWITLRALRVLNWWDRAQH